jgi:hypothetical protein
MDLKLKLKLKECICIYNLNLFTKLYVGLCFSVSAFTALKYINKCLHMNSYQNVNHKAIYFCVEIQLGIRLINFLLYRLPSCFRQS